MKPFDEIKKRIEKDDFKNAIVILNHQIEEDEADELEQPMLLLKSRLFRLERFFHSGIMDFETYDVFKNRLLLFLLDTIKKVKHINSSKIIIEYYREYSIDFPQLLTHLNRKEFINPKDIKILKDSKYIQLENVFLKTMKEVKTSLSFSEGHFESISSGLENMSIHLNELKKGICQIHNFSVKTGINLDESIKNYSKINRAILYGLFAFFTLKKNKQDVDLIRKYIGNKLGNDAMIIDLLRLSNYTKIGIQSQINFHKYKALLNERDLEFDLNRAEYKIHDTAFYEFVIPQILLYHISNADEPYIWRKENVNIWKEN